MFTGIVTNIGTVEKVTKLNEGVKLRIASDYDVKTIALGASIACSGICLTVVAVSDDNIKPQWFEVEAWEEALRLTTLTTWHEGQHINLERSLKLGDEMGGHLVSGHVDGVAEIISREEEGDAVRFRLKVANVLAPFIAQKGSVSLDGTSLTVNDIVDNIFDVLIIRHTLKVTTWGERRTGDNVNIEIDQLARYAARLSGFQTEKK